MKPQVQTPVQQKKKKKKKKTNKQQQKTPEPKLLGRLKIMVQGQPRQTIRETPSPK
jgi:hypothetical protein